MGDQSIGEQIITNLVEKLEVAFPHVLARKNELMVELMKAELDFQVILEILKNAVPNRD